MAIGLGTGGAFTYAGITYAPKNITLSDNFAREMVDISHLGTVSAMAKARKDLYDGGRVSMECEFDPALAFAGDVADATLTVTFPKRPTSASANATLVGAASFLGISNWTIPFEEPMMITIEFEFSTTVAYTAQV